MFKLMQSPLIGKPWLPLCSEVNFTLSPGEKYTLVVKRTYTILNRLKPGRQISCNSIADQRLQEKPLAIDFEWGKGDTVLDLSGIQVAVLGGDDRELVLIPELVKMGAKVAVTGFPERPELAGAHLVGSVAEALTEAQAIIMPMPEPMSSGTFVPFTPPEIRTDRK